jgi:RHS repeat-associated protein
MTNQNLFGPFGEISTLSGTTFGFTGQRYDSELGLYYFKNRYYSPTLGRFLQPDPIGYPSKIIPDCGCACPCSGVIPCTPFELNLYTYVQNSPLVYADPMGLTPPTWDQDDFDWCVDWCDTFGQLSPLAWVICMVFCLGA